MLMLERSVRIREVKGSNPSGSTKSENPNLFPIGEGFGFFHEEENTIHGSSKGIAAFAAVRKNRRQQHFGGQGIWDKEHSIFLLPGFSRAG